MGTRSWTLFLAALVVATATLPTGGSEDATAHLTLVFAGPSASGIASSLGLTIIEEYPDFVLTVASESQRAALSRMAVRWEDASYMRTVQLNGWAFDPLQGVPAFPESLTSAPGDDRAVLQFAGPVKAEWLAAARALGVEFSHYVPNNAFVVALPSEHRDAVAALPHVRWLGPHHPAYRLSPALDEARGPVDVSILTFRGGFERAVSGVRAAGATIRWSSEGGYGGLVRASVDAGDLPHIARSDGIRWIEPEAAVTFHNDRAQWVVQSGTVGSRPVWDHGLHGEGQIIGVADTGIHAPHWAFYDPNRTVQFSSPPGSLPPDLAHRKIVNYHVVPPGGDMTDGWGHGTMTTSIVAGDNTVPGGNGTYNGMADKAKLSFTDFYGAMHVNPPPPDYLFNLTYNDTGRIQSASFGGSTTPPAGYTVNAMLADLFVWEHKDFLPLFSAGNDYRLSVTLNSPATAKNVLGVGATENGVGLEDIKAYSSGGPTADGRLKPDIVSPTDTVTAVDETQNSYAQVGNGTSAAAPAAAGAAALVRQYYTEGWYPSGSKVPANGITPSNALLRATVINGAREASGTGAHDHTYGTMAYPNPDQGWGRILLDDALYFAGDDRDLWMVEHPGLATGETAQFTVSVDNASQPLEITLVWSDYPGDPASSQTAPKLVNDLDLDVWSPTTNFFVGNVYSGSNPGGSVPGGGSYDRLNPVESVLVLPSDMETGAYTVTVRGFNVPQGETGTMRQPFALVVTGGLAVDTTPPAAPRLLSAELSGASSQDVRLTWEKSPDEGQAGGTAAYAVYAGETYDPSGASYASIGEVATTGAASYVFDHAGAGAGDAQSHYYFVQANDSAGNANWSGQAGKLSRSLNAGMHLVSVPLVVVDSSTAALFQTLEYEQVRRYSPGDVADHWKAYAAVKPANDLPAVGMTEGLWVDVELMGEFAVAGLVPQQVTVDLVAGWNLVAYPSLVSRSVGTVLAGVPWTRVEGWDPEAPYNLREMAPSELMEPGRAFWIRCSAAASFMVVN